MNKGIYSRLVIEDSKSIPIILQNIETIEVDKNIKFFTVPTVDLRFKFLVNEKYIDLLLPDPITAPALLVWRDVDVITYGAKYNLKRVFIKSCEYFETEKLYEVELCQDYFSVDYGQFNPTRKRIPRSILQYIA